MKVIYLAAYKALHENHHVVYQDIDGKRDLGGDMLDVDLTKYDMIIATPPCNYWSKANYRRDISSYAIKTKHLLPSIIEKCMLSGKPFVVENVRNKKLFDKYGLNNALCYIYTIGRHTYWSNIRLNLLEILELEKTQIKDFRSNAKRVDGGYILNDGTFSKTNRVERLHKNSQGGENVHVVIEYFLQKQAQKYFEEAIA